MDSVWVEGIEKPCFNELNTDKHTDVLIVGGGVAGILCAYKLREAGVDCILVEAGGICNAITKNTTAKITLAHGLIYDKLISRYGEDKARAYLDAHRRAEEEYARLCSFIDCGYERQDAYVYSLNDRKKIEREVAALRRLGADADFSMAEALPFKTAGALRVKGGGQFHPLKFLYAVARDLPIYENTKVAEFLPYRVKTKGGSITYKKLIVATHFPIFNKHGSYFLKMYQHRSYVLALAGAQTVDGMYVDESDKGLSFRNFRDMLLLGGGGHRTGKQGGCWQELEQFAHKYYKGSRVVAKWATQDTMTLDSAAYIGRYSKNTPDVFVVTGFNKWGMTNAMVAADILCDLVQGKQNQYSAVFDPSRTVFHPQLVANVFESTIGLLTPTVPRCSHLGCALKYNKAEHSWDCSCHGSRFTETGELIDNPATADKKNMPPRDRT